MIFGNFVVPAISAGIPSTRLPGQRVAVGSQATERIWTYNLPKGFLLMVGDLFVRRRATDLHDFVWMHGFVTFDPARQYRWKTWEYDLKVVNLFNRR